MNQQEDLDKVKDEYLNPTPDRKVDRKIATLVSDFVMYYITGERILELGVGDQIWTPKLVDRFPDVTTVDGSSELLRTMNQKISKKSWTPVCSLFENYKPEQKFDTVIATYVLEHVDSPAQILQKARQDWLKDGGRIVITVPHALSLHRRLAIKMGLISFYNELSEADKRTGHKRCFTYDEIQKLIENAGLRLVEKKGMFTKIMPNSFLVQCSDKQLSGMFELGLELPIEYASTIFFLAEYKAP